MHLRRIRLGLQTCKHKKKKHITPLPQVQDTKKLEKKTKKLKYI
jgi:hypothetical protein